jgi:spermidine synthase
MANRRSNFPARSVPHAWLLTLLFLSGLLALVYEIAWQRQFALLLGSAAPATATVLAAYFAGLGLGSWWIGRRAAHTKYPLRLYAWLEVGVAAGAALVWVIQAAFAAVYPFAYQLLTGSPSMLLALKATVTFAALLPPTICLGGTLPLLGRFVDQHLRQLGQTAGRLYVFNTLGAAAGALAMPFWLLPRLGLNPTVGAAMAANVILAAAAWYLHRRHEGSAPPSPASEAPIPPTSRRGALSGARAPIALAAVSGFVTFALQVYWNRAFALVHANSVHAFALIVGVVILALALGGQMARWSLRQGWSPRRIFGVAWCASGLFLLIGPVVFLHASGGLDYLPQLAVSRSPLLSLLGLVLLVLFVPFTLLGVGLPVLMEEAGRRSADDVGPLLGRLLGANLGASVAGALTAGFLLPHLLSLWGNLLLLAALVSAGGAYWLFSARRAGGLAAALICAAGIVLALRSDLPRVRVATAEGEQLVAIQEGTHGIVAVVEQPGSRRLKLDNHYALGGTAALADERLQTHLPLLLHPAPRRVAFLGIGTGISAGAATFHPPAAITAIELVPEVIAAARHHFAEANRGILEQAGTTVVADDARHYLRATSNRYDVIIGDLVVPWRRGEGALFTREQFLAARRALAPGGVFCQWLPLFQLTEIEVEIIIHTFLSVFPEATLWRGDFSPTEPALALIGSPEPGFLDTSTVAQRVTELSPDPANRHLHRPDAVWLHFLGLLSTRNHPFNRRPMNTENRPWIELMGPQWHGGTTSPDLLIGRRLDQWLNRLREETVPPATLGDEVGRAAAAGAALGRFVLALHQQDGPAAEAARHELERLLSPELLAALFSADA